MVSTNPTSPKNELMKYKTNVTIPNITKNLYPSACIFGKILLIITLVDNFF